MLPAPSAAARYLPRIREVVPSGSSIVATTEVPSCSAERRREPNLARTVGRVDSAVRNAVSRLYWAVHWAGSGNSELGTSDRANTPSKTSIRRPARPVQNTTESDQPNGSPEAARTASATPSLRKCSIERGLTCLHLGVEVSGSSRGSTRTTSTPRLPSSWARVRPTGPPPTTTTSVSTSASVVREVVMAASLVGRTAGPQPRSTQ